MCYYNGNDSNLIASQLYDIFEELNLKAPNLRKIEITINGLEKSLILKYDNQSISVFVFNKTQKIKIINHIIELLNLNYNIWIIKF